MASKRMRLKKTKSKKEESEETVMPEETWKNLFEENNDSVEKETVDVKQTHEHNQNNPNYPSLMRLWHYRVCDACRDLQQKAKEEEIAAIERHEKIGKITITIQRESSDTERQIVRKFYSAFPKDIKFSIQLPKFTPHDTVDIDFLFMYIARFFRSVEYFNCTNPHADKPRMEFYKNITKKD